MQQGLDLEEEERQLLELQRKTRERFDEDSMKKFADCIVFTQIIYIDKNSVYTLCFTVKNKI